MNKNIVIRKAREEDFRQVHELILKVHKIHVLNRNDIYKETDPIDFNMYKEQISNDNNICLVAETNNNLVGICFGEIKVIVNNKIMRDRKIIHIGDICVSTDYQRMGIGTALYNEMLNLARKQKIDSIELMVWNFNKSAIDFYKSLGMNIKNIKFEQKID